MLKKVLQKLKKCKKAHIFVHASVDGDAVASSLVIAYSLVVNKKNAVIYTDDLVEFDRIKQRIGTLIKYHDIFDNIDIRKSVQGEDLILKGSVLLAVDCFGPPRFGRELQNELNNYFSLKGIGDIQSYFSVIDHHRREEGLLMSDSSWVESEMTSASEMCFRAVCHMGSIFKLANKMCDISNIAFFGIASDTGFFKFVKSGKFGGLTLSLISRMVAKGFVNPSLVNVVLRPKHNKEYLDYLSVLLSGCEYISTSSAQIAIVCDSQEYFNKYGKDARPNTAIFDTLFSVENVDVIFFVKYKEQDFTSCSIRVQANSTFKANEFASKFGGGGHIKASGFTSQVSPDVLKQKIIEELKNV